MLIIFFFFILILTSIPISSPSGIYPHHKPASHEITLNRSAGFSLPIYHISHPKILRRFPFSPLFSGAKNKFVMVVTLGNPEVSNLLIVDTGSDICWMFEAEYKRSESLSYRGIDCKDEVECTDKVPSPACSLQHNCYFSLKYYDEKIIAGDFVGETFYLFDRAAEHGVATVEFNMSFGLVNPYGFDDFRADGVLGLNFGSLGTLTALKVDTFSVCFPDPIRSGISVSSYVRFGYDAILGVECTSLAYAYHLVFFVESIKVANATLSKISREPSGAYFTFDTGAEESYLHPYAMDAVVDTLREIGKDKELESTKYELCYSRTKGSPPSNFDFSFQLRGGATLRMDSTNLWVAVGRERVKYCLAMQRSKTKSEKIILGMTQIWGKNYGFDWTNKKLCFHNRDCTLP